MEDADTLTLKPNHPGLLMATGLFGFGVFISVLVLKLLAREAFLNLQDLEWLLVSALVALLMLLLLAGCLNALWIHLRVLFGSFLPSGAVRINRQGLYFPLRYQGVIDWKWVQQIEVHHGYNGSSLWFMIDPSLPLRGYSVLDRIGHLWGGSSVGYVRLPSHQYRFSAPALWQALNRLAPASVQTAYPVA